MTVTPPEGKLRGSLHHLPRAGLDLSLPSLELDPAGAAGEGSEGGSSAGQGESERG